MLLERLRHDGIYSSQSSANRTYSRQVKSSYRQSVMASEEDLVFGTMQHKKKIVNIGGEG